MNESRSIAPDSVSFAATDFEVVFRETGKEDVWKDLLDHDKGKKKQLTGSYTYWGPGRRPARGIYT
jgi:hypothetical protein